MSKNEGCSVERLEITPQGMTEIFKGRNRPTGERLTYGQKNGAP